MPALDILRALIHPGKSQKSQAQGKKLRKQSTLRTKKPESVTSSGTDTGHGQRDIPLSLKQRPYHKDEKSVRRNPSIRQHGPVYADPPYAPVGYGPGSHPTSHSHAPIYPQETQYYEYDRDHYSVAPPGVPQTGHSYYPSKQGGADDSWHQSAYEVPEQAHSENQPQFYIEPSEAEEWSPIPDVHRQSTSSESLHGTFGLGDRSSRQNIDSMALSDGRWTSRAEYDQSAVYELYEEDPDASRPVSSYYPPKAPSIATHPRVTQHNASGHGDPMPIHHPPGIAGSALSSTHKEARQTPPTLAIPQPLHSTPPHRHPLPGREVNTPSRSGSIHCDAEAVELRERSRSPWSAPEVHDGPPPPPHAGSSLPSRQNSIRQQLGQHNLSPERGSNRGQRPTEQHWHDTLAPVPQRQGIGKEPVVISAESINPEIYDRDYGSDDEVYQYIVPMGVDVIFRDNNGVEITRVGEFPEPPPPESKKSRSAPMVVIDENGTELYRNFGQSKRRGFKYDGHILHDESTINPPHLDHRHPIQTPRSTGSNSSRTSTKTFLIDGRGNQIPIGSNDGSGGSSSRPSRQPSKYTSHR